MAAGIQRRRTTAHDPRLSQLCWKMTLLIALAILVSAKAYQLPSTALTSPPRSTRLVTSSSSATRHWASSQAEPQDTSSVDDDSEDGDQAAAAAASPSPPDVTYTKAIMPVPQHPHRSSQMSHVSWEEVLIAQPATTNTIDRAGTTTTTTRKDVSLIALVSVGFTFLFSALVHMSGPGAWRYYLAGGLCAAISHAIPVPIDVVKTRKQVDPVLANMDFASAMRWMIKNEGPRSLWAGLGPTALGYLIEGSIKFGVYEATKPVIKRLLVTVAAWSSSLAFLNSHVLNLILCGMASGFAASIALCPMEALRIRLVAQKNAKANFVRAGLHMVQNEGITSMTRGMIPMLYKQVPYTVFKNGSFDLSARAAYAYMRNRGLPVSPTHKVSISVLAAALASVLSCISSQPGDMLLSLMNAHEGERRRTRDIIRDILRSDRGVRGFFVGIKTRFVHVGVIVTLQLFIYDVVKQLCGIAATGSV